MMNRWGWLCPWLAIALAAGVFVLWGLSWWATRGQRAGIITFWSAVKPQ